jgi:bifunctional non-homologous end joining protein LigD
VVTDISAGIATLYSRSGEDISDRYNVVAEALRRIRHDCVLDGIDLRELTLLERKKQLKSILVPHKLLNYCDHRFEHGRRCFAEAKRKKAEGIMAKRAASMYLSGKRSMEWQKIKTGARQEIVIVGYMTPRRSRKFFGSLVLAVRKGAHWQYVGHVGTGFDRASLEDIHTRLQPLRTANKPFQEKVKYDDQTTWVTPGLVGEVKFAE